MTIESFGDRYKIDLEVLYFFKKNKLLPDLETDANLKRISTLCTLYDSGFDAEEMKKYLFFSDIKDKKELIKLLSTKRHQILDIIHKNNKSLDKLDYIIYELEKQKED